jgi:hypothetical protein
MIYELFNHGLTPGFAKLRRGERINMDSFRNEKANIRVHLCSSVVYLKKKSARK